MIIFRVDGNEQIGLGHVMRCLSIAEALHNDHELVSFVTADNKCESLIKRKGFNCISLNTDYKNLETELNPFCDIIINNNPQMVIIDSYYVTELYLDTIRKITKTVYIDDVLSFAYPADIVINYNIFCTQRDYEKLYRGFGDKPKFILGTEYVPLRKEYQGLTPRKQPEIARRIFVSTGGADPQHVAIRLIRYIIEHNNDLHEYIFTFIIGLANTDKELIIELAERVPNINILSNVQNMSRVMLTNDIAISAAGSTLYELCACGIPTITYTLADNQIPAAKAFCEKGIMINVGDLRTRNDRIDSIITELQRLSVNRDHRLEMTNKAIKVTNGLGADYITKNIIKILYGDSIRP